jgi:CspA family cold shock protein
VPLNLLAFSVDRLAGAGQNFTASSILACRRVSRSELSNEQTDGDYTTMATGTVKWFNATKGFGFIQPEGGGPDVFVHISAVERAGLRGLNEGQRLEYELQSERGKTAAVNLKSL